MKIYTKAGDSGQTTFGGCEMNKNNPTAEAIGTIDELNSQLGVTRYHILNNELQNLLLKIQNDLFVIGAVIHGAKNQKITETHIQLLEALKENHASQVGETPIVF
ncbi:MAG: yvqK [Bacillales bacterium]|nr:yvqK [Bacillales bacterium]